MEISEKILNEKTYLGIEFGSTRIKAVLIDDKANVLAGGDHEWENSYLNGIWTYSPEDIWSGLQDCYANLKKNVYDKYNVTLTGVSAIGISAMMHGYLAFDKNDNLLVPFRTWRNTITEQASKELTESLNYNIPQRWSVAHLYQAILNKEEHISQIEFFTTLAGYVHWKLTGKKVLGIGDASGMFPINPNTLNYDENMISVFDELAKNKGFYKKLNDILPEVLVAGENAGCLTDDGAKLLDPSGDLKSNIKMAPPEGDAGTGMTATNSVGKRTIKGISSNRSGYNSGWCIGRYGTLQ